MTVSRETELAYKSLLEIFAEQKQQAIDGVIPKREAREKRLHDIEFYAARLLGLSQPKILSHARYYYEFPDELTKPEEIEALKTDTALVEPVPDKPAKPERRGRKPALTEAEIQEAKELRKKGWTCNQIAGYFNGKVGDETIRKLTKTE